MPFDNNPACRVCLLSMFSASSGFTEITLHLPTGGSLNYPPDALVQRCCRHNHTTMNKYTNSLANSFISCLPQLLDPFTNLLSPLNEKSQCNVYLLWPRRIDGWFINILVVDAMQSIADDARRPDEQMVAAQPKRRSIKSKRVDN